MGIWFSYPFKVTEDASEPSLPSKENLKPDNKSQEPEFDLKEPGSVKDVVVDAMLPQKSPSVPIQEEPIVLKQSLGSKEHSFIFIFFCVSDVVVSFYACMRFSILIGCVKFLMVTLGDNTMVNAEKSEAVAVAATGVAAATVVRSQSDKGQAKSTKEAPKVSWGRLLSQYSQVNCSFSLLVECFALCISLIWFCLSYDDSCMFILL